MDNLDKYKNAWKNETGFEERKLSDKELARFMQASSKSLATFYKKGLLVDLILKSLLLLGGIYLWAISQNLPVYLLPSTFMTLILGITVQSLILRKIPIVSAMSLADKLRSHIDFFYRQYIFSIFIGALSGALLFLLGSLYYYFYKYQGVPRLETEDLMVLGIGLVLSFGMSALVQWKQGHFQIKQLEKSLQEIETDTFSERGIKRYGRNRRRNIWLMSLLALAGLILLILLVYQFFSLVQH